MTTSIRIEHFDPQHTAQATQRSTDLSGVGYKVSKYTDGATIVVHNGDTNVDEYFNAQPGRIVLVATK
jgi:hypothetical protein